MPWSLAERSVVAGGRAADALAGAGTLTLHFTQSDHELITEITDTGPGLAPEMVEVGARWKFFLHTVLRRNARIRKQGRTKNVQSMFSLEMKLG